MSEPTREIKSASTIYVRTNYVRCPHCGDSNDGWVGKPNPETVETCTSCGEQFKVAEDADIKFD